jgi:hypothetical protein
MCFFLEYMENLMARTAPRMIAETTGPHGRTVLSQVGNVHMIEDFVPCSMPHRDWTLTAVEYYDDNDIHGTMQAYNDRCAYMKGLM